MWEGGSGYIYVASLAKVSRVRRGREGLVNDNFQVTGMGDGSDSNVRL